MSDIKIVIGADVGQATAGLSKLNTSLVSFKNTSGQATQAMVNLGRVVQDAPYGFIGIANNLNPLLESFQRLKAESGSTGGALKALGSSLMGAGGLGIAVSAVTSLLTVFAMSSYHGGQSASALTKEVEILKTEFDDAKDSLEGFNKEVDALRNLRRINLQINIPGESVKDKLLRQEVDYLATKGEEQRKLNNLIVLEGKARERSEATFAILQRDASKNLSDAISKTNTLQQARKIATNLSENDYKLLNESIAASDDIFKNLEEQSIQRTKIQQLDKENLVTVKAINAEESERIKKIRTISDVIADLNKNISTIEKTEILFGIDDTKNKVSSIKKAIDELFKDFKLTPTSPLIVDLKFKIDKLNADKAFKDLIDSIDLVPDREKKPVKINVNVQPQFKVDAAGIDKEAYRLADDINTVVQNVFVDVFAGLGQAIGDAMSGVSLSGAFDGIIKSLAGGLKQIGQMIIQTNVQLAILKKVGFSNPVVGIAVGIAITALGTLLQNSIGKTKAFATGVRNFQGGFATVGERGPETVFLPRGSSVQPNNEMLAYGGGGVTLQPSLSYDGTRFRIFLDRVDQQMGRNN